MSDIPAGRPRKPFWKKMGYSKRPPFVKYRSSFLGGIGLIKIALHHIMVPYLKWQEDSYTNPREDQFDEEVADRVCALVRKLAECYREAQWIIKATEMEGQDHGKEERPDIRQESGGDDHRRASQDCDDETQDQEAPEPERGSQEDAAGAGPDDP